MNKKRALSLTVMVIGILLLSNCVSASPNVDEVSDNLIDIDIKASNWAKMEVHEALVNGILRDTGMEKSVDMTTDISREQLTEMTLNYVKQYTSRAKLEQIKSMNELVRFDDTNNLKLIEASQLGIIKGRDDGKFHPYDNITREDVATILKRAESIVWGELYRANENILSIYEDGSQVSSWAKQGVAYFTHTQQLLGSDDGRFYPKSNMTKQEAAIFINRLFVVKRESIIMEQQ